MVRGKNRAEVRRGGMTCKIALTLVDIPWQFGNYSKDMPIIAMAEVLGG